MKVCILGVGNILFKDEGFGVFVAKYIENNFKFDKEIEVVDGGTGGFKLIEYFQDYDYVILVDVLSINDKPGSIYKIEGDKLADISSYHQTAHEVEVLQMIDLAKISGRSANVIVIGVVPEDITKTEIGLTSTLEEVFPYVVNHVLNQLKSLGFNPIKIKDKSIKDIVLREFGQYNQYRR